MLRTTASLWHLEPAGQDRFHGWCTEGAPNRVFGGQVLAQAVAAAGADLPDGGVESLHAYFVREGRSAEPIEYVVERTSDDASQRALRHVTAVQGGKPILVLDAAFQRDAGPPVSVPSPGDPPAWTSDDSEEARWLADRSHRIRFELRFEGPPAFFARRDGQTVEGQRFWLRATDTLPDQALPHAYALVYVSDMMLVSTALASHGLMVRGPGVQSASLDHALWFHRPVRLDEWVLYEQASPTSAGGRGLSTGRFTDRAGNLVATVRQEVLLRLTE